MNGKCGDGVAGVSWSLKSVSPSCMAWNARHRFCGHDGTDVKPGAGFAVGWGDETFVPEWHWREATADPSTAFGARGAPNFAQDDKFRGSFRAARLKPCPVTGRFAHVLRRGAPFLATLADADRADLQARLLYGFDGGFLRGLREHLLDAS